MRMQSVSCARAFAISLVAPGQDVWSGTDGATPDLADLLGGRLEDLAWVRRVVGSQQSVRRVSFLSREKLWGVLVCFFFGLERGTHAPNLVEGPWDPRLPEGLGEGRREWGGRWEWVWGRVGQGGRGRREGTVGGEEGGSADWPNSAIPLNGRLWPNRLWLGVQNERRDKASQEEDSQVPVSSDRSGRFGRKRMKLALVGFAMQLDLL